MNSKSDMDSNCIRKIIDSKTNEVYLLATSNINEGYGLNLLLTDCSSIWETDLCEADIDDRAKNVHMSVHEYKNLTWNILTDGEDNSNDFTFEVEKSQEMRILKWKRLIRDENIMFQLGDVEMCRVDKPLSFLMEKTVENLQSAVGELKNTRNIVLKLTEDRDRALKLLEEKVLQKEELEKVHFSKFVRVLNAKKAYLKDVGPSQTAQQPSPTSSSSDKKETVHTISESESDGATTDEESVDGTSIATSTSTVPQVTVKRDPSTDPVVEDSPSLVAPLKRQRRGVGTGARRVGRPPNGGEKAEARRTKATISTEATTPRLTRQSSGKSRSVASQDTVNLLDDL